MHPAKGHYLTRRNRGTYYGVQQTKQCKPKQNNTPQLIKGKDNPDSFTLKWPKHKFRRNPKMWSFTRKTTTTRVWRSQRTRNSHFPNTPGLLDTIRYAMWYNDIRNKLYSACTYTHLLNNIHNRTKITKSKITKPKTANAFLSLARSATAFVIHLQSSSTTT